MNSILHRLLFVIKKLICEILLDNFINPQEKACQLQGFLIIDCHNQPTLDRQTRSHNRYQTSSWFNYWLLIKPQLWFAATAMFIFFGKERSNLFTFLTKVSWSYSSLINVLNFFSSPIVLTVKPL